MSLIIPVASGILMGYLINYISDEFPDSQRFRLPVCRNQACRHPYTWNDYLFAARCRKCGWRRNPRTFLILALSIFSGLYLWFRPPEGLGFVPGILILTYLILVGVIDFEHRLIFRTLSIAGLILTSLAGFFLHGWKVTAIGGIFSFGIMFLVYLLGIRYSRWISKTRNLEPGEVEEAFGSGDVTLAVILGLFLGWPLIKSVLLLGFILLGIFVFPFAFVLFLKQRFHNPRLVYIPVGAPFILSTIILFYLPTLIPILLPK
jgi:leader peptidase (prepilin peptidase)/N-methyltransferase